MVSENLNVVRTAVTGSLFAAALAVIAPPACAQTAEKAVVVRAADWALLVSRAQATQDGANPPRPQVVLPIVSTGSYVFNLERHVGKGPGSLHPVWAEYVIVLQGSGTVATGGTVVNPVKSADGNVHGTDISDGTPQHVAPGDLMIVPQGVAHILTSDADGPLVVATLHVPRNDVAAAQTGPDTIKLIHHAVDLPGIMSRAREAQRKAGSLSSTALLSLPPYRVVMEYASARGTASLHRDGGTFIYVLEGEGDFVTDGSIIHSRVMGTEVDGDDIQGGSDNRIRKGDFVYLPKNVPYLAKTNGTFVLATLLVPEP